MTLLGEIEKLHGEFTQSLLLGNLSLSLTN